MPIPRGNEVKEKLKTPVSLPAGTVTFLFSDIEGSTHRWEAHREAMEAAVERHDQILRNAIETNNGYVFKTVGDAFCAAFRQVSDAVAAAIDAQRALVKEDFSGVDGLGVRMGIHTGEASERDGDYFGPTLNRSARLMSIGHGGQVLLSDATRQRFPTTAPSGTALLDLGLRRLKDLTQPERVWQLAIAGLPTQFPPLSSLDARPNNLPIQLTSLVGRERDLGDVKALLDTCRLVTLSGSGGVGKTRVALQIGADLIDRFRDGVWFADLAPITDPELVSSVIAKVLGISQQEGRRVDESIPRWLKGKQLLIILDNCEHVVEAAARIADAIIHNCSEVLVLSTSRQALGISGEVVHRLPSLAIPDKGLRANEALAYGAIALFVDRAKAAETRFALTDDNAPIVTNICRRLDGIPLAIELAAARVSVLSIPHLAQRLDERFKILTGGSRTALPRQKTLVALIDWSYDLLTAQEQTLFNRLGIFAGAFSLAAAATVCGWDGVDEIEILDLLSSLTGKSLVVADTGGERERYHLLESTRAYALEKLNTIGERDRLGRRHGEYFCAQAQESDERYGTSSTETWLASVELEIDNYRAVLEWGLTQGEDTVVGAAIAGALESLWFRGGLAAEGRYWMGLALGRVSEAERPQVVARLWLALAWLLSGRRMFEAAQRAVVLYESTRDHRRGARAQDRLAFALVEMGRLEEASDTVSRALPVLREQGDNLGVASCLITQAYIANCRGNVAAGRDLLMQALAVYKMLGEEMGTAAVLGNLAELEFADGRPEEALRSVSEALEIYSRGKDVVNLAIYHDNSAAYRIALGDLDGAGTSLREGLRFARRAQAAQYIAISLQHFALLAALRGQMRTAASLLGYVNAQFQELGIARETTEEWGYKKLMAVLCDHLGEADITKLAAEGAAWSEDQAAEEALTV